MRRFFTIHSKQEFKFKTAGLLLLGGSISIIIFSFTEQYVPASIACHTLFLIYSIWVFRNKAFIDRNYSDQEIALFRFSAILNIVAYIVLSPGLLWLWLCYSVVENPY